MQNGTPQKIGRGNGKHDSCSTTGSSGKPEALPMAGVSILRLLYIHKSIWAGSLEENETYLVFPLSSLI